VGASTQPETRREEQVISRVYEVQGSAISVLRSFNLLEQSSRSWALRGYILMLIFTTWFKRHSHGACLISYNLLFPQSISVRSTLPHHCQAGSSVSDSISLYPTNWGGALNLKHGNDWLIVSLKPHLWDGTYTPVKCLGRDIPVFGSLAVGKFIIW